MSDFLTSPSHKPRIQQLQEQERASIYTIPACCLMCGKRGAELYVAIERYDKWVLYRKIYKKERRRYLCKECRHLYRPSLQLAIEQGNKGALRAIPVFDEAGNMLQHTCKAQIQLLPEYWPVWDLGCMECDATFTERIMLRDCVVWKLNPDSNQDVNIDWVMNNRHGFILTTMSLQGQPSVLPPARVRFHSYFTHFDMPRTQVLWPPVHKLPPKSKLKIPSIHRIPQRFEVQP